MKEQKRTETTADSKVVIGTFMSLCQLKKCPTKQLHAINSCFVDENNRCVVEAECTGCGTRGRHRMNGMVMTCFDKATKSCEKRRLLSRCGAGDKQNEVAETAGAPPKRGLLSAIRRLFGR